MLQIGLFVVSLSHKKIPSNKVLLRDSIYSLLMDKITKTKYYRCVYYAKEGGVCTSRAEGTIS